MLPVVQGDCNCAPCSAGGLYLCYEITSMRWQRCQVLEVMATGALEAKLLANPPSRAETVYGVVLTDFGSEDKIPASRYVVPAAFLTAHEEQLLSSRCLNISCSAPDACGQAALLQIHEQQLPFSLCIRTSCHQRLKAKFSMVGCTQNPVTHPCEHKL